MKMKIVKCQMTTILMNQNKSKDLDSLLVNKRLVYKIFLVKEHPIIIYLVKIIKLKIINLVNLLKVLYNKQAQDNSKQILLKI